MLTQNLTFDVLSTASAPIICRLGEGEARRIIFAVTSGGNQGPDTVYPNIENPVITVRFLKPDRTFVYVTADLISAEEGIQEFAFNLPSEVSQVSGIGRYDIRIQEDGEDNIVYSAEGMLIVDDDMITADMIASVAAVNGLLFPDDFLTTDSNVATIDDTTASDDSTWSSSKIVSEIDDVVSELIDDSLVDDDSTWSSEKILSEIEDKVSDLLDDSETALDTTWSSSKIADEIAANSPIHAYSTTPVKVGEWIDGSDIYEVVMPFSPGKSILSGAWEDIYSNPIPSGAKIIDTKYISSGGAGTGWTSYTGETYQPDATNNYVTVLGTCANGINCSAIIWQYIAA